MTQILRTWLLAWREAFTCVGLGLRDARHARHAGLWWRSALWCMAVVALVSVTGLLGLGVRDGVGTLASGPATLSQMGNIAGGLGRAAKALLSIGQIALALAAFFYVMVFIVGAIGTARLPLRWLLLARAKVVAARRYVAWQAPTGLELSAARPAWRRRLLLLRSLLIKLADLAENSDLSKIDMPTRKDVERGEKYRRAMGCLVTV